MGVGEDTVTDKNKRPGKYFYQSQLFRKIAAEDPVVLIDVGARGGIHPKWRPLHGVIKAIGFEPDADECRRLNEAAVNNHTYFPVALFNKKGKVNINMTREPVCSSILEPNHALLNRFLASEEFEVTGSIEVTCDSLDGIVQSNGIKDIDFIKLDTQGTELQILQGAVKTLAEYCVFGIEVELEFSPMYKDQPLFGDVDRFLRANDYSLFDIAIPLGRKIRKTAPNQSKYLKGQGLWTTAIYFKDFGSGEHPCLGKLSLSKALKTIAITELHGYNDFALELAELYLKKGIITVPMCSEIKEMLAVTGEKFSPEVRLYRKIKSDAGEFLSERFPAIHKWLVSVINRGRI